MKPTTRPVPVVVPVMSGTDTVVRDRNGNTTTTFDNLGNATVGTDTDSTTAAPSSFLGMTDNQRLALYVVLGFIVLVVLFMVMRRMFASKDGTKVVTAAAAVPVSSVAVPLAQAGAATAA